MTSGEPPAGVSCPGCGRVAAFVFGEEQAYCAAGDCAVFCWNPLWSVAENFDRATRLDPGGTDGER